MKIRFAVPVASAATAILMLGACSDDGPTTLAKGDVRFAEGSGLGGQTMDIAAVEQDGQVTGEARFSFGLVLNPQCADTDTDGTYGNSAADLAVAASDASLTVFFEINNALNRRNACCTEYELDDEAEQPTLVLETIRSVPLTPSLGVVWRF